MADWVLAAERAYIARATGGDVPTGGRPEDLGRARAAAGAVASHFLAIAAPRSFGLIADTATVADAALSLAAHQTWFAPQDLRCAGPGADELAREISGRATSVAEALACDIVCIHAPLLLEASALRRGTHLNVLAPATLDDELSRLATVIHEEPGLAEVAAGLVDGRQLDEISVFVLGNAELALAAVSSTS